MGIIYMGTSPSGKKYIGQHTSNNFAKRLYTHQSHYYKFLKQKTLMELQQSKQTNPNGFCTSLCCAFQKYGFCNFTWEVLYDNVPKRYLNDLEDAMIRKHKSLAPNGYNLKTNAKHGGKSAYSDASRKKMSESQKIVMKNKLHKYRRGHGMLEGVPQHVTYFKSGGIRGYRIQNHPNCSFKQFADADTPVKELKKQLLDFMAQCEEKKYETVQHVKQIKRGIPKGISEDHKIGRAHV